MINANINDFDKERFYLLKHKIKNTKSQYDTYLDKNHTLKGYRYNDDDRIARMVVGYIYAESKLDLETAKKKFLALNSTEIEPYIKGAILESAITDYHYTYEKNYD